MISISGISFLIEGCGLKVAEHLSVLSKYRVGV